MYAKAALLVALAATAFAAPEVQERQDGAAMSSALAAASAAASSVYNLATSNLAAA